MLGPFPNLAGHFNLRKNRRRVAAGFDETIELLEADPLPLPLLAALTAHLRHTAAGLLASSTSGDPTAHHDGNAATNDKDKNKSNDRSNTSPVDNTPTGAGGLPCNLSPSLSSAPRESPPQARLQEPPTIAAAADRKTREQLAQKQRGQEAYQEAMAAAQRLQEQQIQEEQIQQFRRQLQEQEQLQQQQRQHVEYRSSSHEQPESPPHPSHIHLEQYQQMQMQAAAAAQYQAQAAEMQQMLLQAVLSSGGPLPDWVWHLPQAPSGLMHHPDMLHDEVPLPPAQGAPMGMAPGLAAALYSSMQPGISVPSRGHPGSELQPGRPRDFNASARGASWPHR